jgi:hypothetical protein
MFMDKAAIIEPKKKDVVVSMVLVIATISKHVT